ncbi:MAG: LamG domain-containing protein [Verrucomicrobia bacterium]|nr:LamG domain-containing protein [Verrucomicrobiota bacterium]
MKTTNTLLLTAALAGLPATAGAQSWLTDGLVAYYPFNGNANDESGSGNHGTVTAATLAVDRSGNLNSAYAFNGGSSVITVPDSPSLRIPKDITVVCWLNFAVTAKGVRLIGKGSDGSRNYGLWYDPPSGSWLFQQFPPSGSCQENTGSVGPIVQTGRWYQMVGVRSGSVSRFYLDGELLREGPVCSTSTYTGGEPLTIGAFQNLSDSRFSVMNGSLDDIRIYNRAFSSDEVAQLYSYERFCSPHKATATAEVVNGFVVGAIITDGGCGYTEAPLVLVQGGGGSGAVATAVISNGDVVAINITNAGRGYTSTPKIEIASPPFVPTVSIAVSKVKVTQNVVLGRNYVLESSRDLANWTAVGPSFTATSETITDEFDVDVTGRFFRIRQVP